MGETPFTPLQRACPHPLKRAPYCQAVVVRQFMGQSPTAPVGVNESMQVYAMLDHEGRVQYFDRASVDAIAGRA